MRCQVCGKQDTSSSPMFQLACGRPTGRDRKVFDPMEIHFNVQVCKRCGGQKLLDEKMAEHMLTCEYRQHQPAEAT